MKGWILLLKFFCTKVETLHAYYLEFLDTYLSIHVGWILFAKLWIDLWKIINELMQFFEEFLMQSYGWTYANYRIM